MRDDSPKDEARSRAKAFLRAMDPESSAQLSAAAASKIRESLHYQEAETVLAFLSMKGEIDTAALVDGALGDGKDVAVPRIVGEDIVFVPLPPGWRLWSRDRFGIPEPPLGVAPLGLEELGRKTVLVITPGLAFDLQGGRLGRGKGFYDRFLRSLRSASAMGGGKALALALCFHAQIVDEIPMGDHDERVDAIATEKGILPILV